MAQLHRGSAVPSFVRNSTSASVSAKVAKPRRKAPCVGFLVIGASSSDAEIELSSWSSKLY